MKIVLYGGTFDPIHNEHVKLVKGALRELSPDKLIILPSYVPPHKASAMTSANERYEMAKLAFAFDGRIEVCDYEITRGGSSYSYLTVEHFRETYPEDELFFLIGGDSFFEFDNWVNPQIIATKAKIVVVSRGGFTERLMARNVAFERTYGYKAKILSFTGDITSSTYIRYCLMLGVDSGEMPPPVAEYIFERGLYSGGEIFEYIKSKLKTSRRAHTAGVIECALELNKQLGLDKRKVVLAAALHDVAKYLRAEDFPDFNCGALPRAVVHAFLGEYVAREVLGVTDCDVLLAIRYHTTGRANMTGLEKLVYVADLLERNRTYPGVDKLRKLTRENFENGFVECVRQGYKHLKQMKMSDGVHYLTAEAYEFYNKQIKK